MRTNVEAVAVSKSAFAREVAEPDLESVSNFATDPVAQARELVGLWYAHCGGPERTNEVSFELRWLNPWADYLAVLKAVDHGTDFEIGLVAEGMARFFDHDVSLRRLSNLRSPYRQAMRQVLLRAFMTRAPAAENYDWLVDGVLRSCIACAMPIASRFDQPSELVLAVFPRRPMLQIDAIDLRPTDLSTSNGRAVWADAHA